MNKARVKGFTLIELLAVVAIVLILMSLLLPVISGIRGLAMIVRCKAVVKNFGTTALLFAADHEGRLPAMSTAGSYYGPPPFTNGWMGSEVALAQPALVGNGNFRYEGALQTYMHAPTGVGQSYYRCPLLPVAPFGSAAIGNDSYGSNGGFDYTMFSYANGATVSRLPRKAFVSMPADGSTQSMPAPIFTEEDPRYGNNNNFIDPDHTSINRDGVWHYRGVCMYFCSDGSIQEMAYRSPLGPEARSWTAYKTAQVDGSNVLINIGNLGTWDIWNRVN